MEKPQGNKLILEAKTRTIFGRKVKKLRADGFIPANIYGREFKSQAITVNFKDFIKIYKTAKETGIVYLKLNENLIPVLIKNLQRDPLTDNILHVDFRKIDLDKKVQTEVPIKVVGVSKAVKELGAILLTHLNSLLIEALPQNIPPTIDIDISSLNDIGQEIKVNDLPKTNNYDIKTAPEKVIVSVIAHKEESTTPETTSVAPEVITEIQSKEAAPEEDTEKTIEK